MGKKPARNQKKKVEGKGQAAVKGTAKGTHPNPKAKGNNGSAKGTAPLFEVSCGDLYEVHWPMAQEHCNDGWIYPQQFPTPSYAYVGYYTNNQFIGPEHFHPVQIWNYGCDAPDNTMGYASNANQPVWDRATFAEPAPAADEVDEMIASITGNSAEPMEIFQLRADAPEFVPQRKMETKAA